MGYLGSCGVMLIVCPSCATSYVIENASVGPAGRTVRCARCRTTWFVGPAGSTSDITAFVNGVIAEAEAETQATPHATAARASPPAADDDFGAHDGRFASAQAGRKAGGFAAAPDPFSDLRTVPPVSDSPSLVPPIEEPEAHASIRAAHEPENIETFAARRSRLQAKRKKSRRASRWTAIVLVLLAFNVALVGARNEIVRFLPQTASLFAAIGLPVNLRHLNFEDVRIVKETEGGTTILVVQGRIVSAGGRAVEVPRLRFSARNATGQELYTWSAKPERSILGPGESIKFHTQLAAPPPEAIDVMVRFFKAQDAVPGAKDAKEKKK